jgi:tetratricopeptide (TPR) repeat protein
MNMDIEHLQKTIGGIWIQLCGFIVAITSIYIWENKDTIDNYLIYSLLLLFLFLLILVTLIIKILYKSKENIKTFRGLWHLYSKVTDVQIEIDIAIPNPNKYYLQRDTDEKIKINIRNGDDILITGRPKLGKTRSAYEAIKNFGDYYLVIPKDTINREQLGIDDYKLFFEKISKLLLKMKFIILFDDIQKNDWEEVFSIIKIMKMKCSACIVVATCRTGNEYYEYIAKSKNFLLFNKIIDLKDITSQDWEKISEVTGIKKGTYDGTPGSVFIPEPSEMKERYNKTDEKYKNILIIIKILFISGIKLYPYYYFRPRIYLLYNYFFFENKRNDRFFDENIKYLCDQGLIKVEKYNKKEYIKMYDHYIEDFIQYTPARNDYKRLINFFNGSYNSQIIDTNALSILGNHLIKEEEYILAKECFKSYFSIYPKNQSVIIRLGYVLTKLGKIKKDECDNKEAIKLYKDAIQYYEKALKINYKNKTAHNNLGYTYSALQEVESSRLESFDNISIEEFSKAIQIDNTYISPYRGRALVYFRLEQYENSEKDYKKCIDLDPTSILTNYANLLNILDREDEAITYLKNLIDSNCNDFIALYSLGAILCKYKYRNTKNSNGIFYHMEGIKYLERALEIDKNNISANLCLSNAYATSNKYEKSENIIKNLLRTDPNNLIILNSYGSLLSRWGDFLKEKSNLIKATEMQNRSIQKFTVALSINPKNEDSLLGYAVTNEKLGKYNIAERYYRKIIFEINPKNRKAINTYYIFLKEIIKHPDLAVKFAKKFKIQSKVLERDNRKTLKK